jgi:hypothetical protein
MEKGYKIGWGDGKGMGVTSFAFPLACQLSPLIKFPNFELHPNGPKLILSTV